MILEGVVTNVTNFGAFVDIGVHQDGLVHISALTNRYISDPREVVKAGDIVKVKVVEVDIPRKRIALTMRLDDEVVRTKQTHQKEPQTKQHKHGSHHHHAHDKQSQHQGNNAFAAAFANAKRSK